jgi:hypothetical protein
VQPTSYRPWRWIPASACRNDGSFSQNENYWPSKRLLDFLGSGNYCNPLFKINGAPVTGYHPATLHMVLTMLNFGSDSAHTHVR